MIVTTMEAVVVTLNWLANPIVFSVPGLEFLSCINGFSSVRVRGIAKSFIFSCSTSEEMVTNCTFNEKSRFLLHLMFIVLM